MKDTKKFIVTTITLASALIAFVSASAAVCMLEGKTDIKYVLKKKAKREEGREKYGRYRHHCGV